MGETPSKKNSRINTKSGRSFPNQRYVKWHDRVISELHVLLLQKQIRKFEGVKVKLTVTFFHENLVRRDSDNQLSSILDTLVDAGILEDDNWKIIPRKIINDEYDKNNARCEIILEEINV
jgi:Holliday junction resolvase RusA-like endonuclease